MKNHPHGQTPVSNVTRLPKHPYAVTFDKTSTEPLDAWMKEQLEKLEASQARFTTSRSLRQSLER